MNRRGKWREIMIISDAGQFAVRPLEAVVIKWASIFVRRSDRMSPFSSLGFRVDSSLRADADAEGKLLEVLALQSVVVEVS